MKLMTINFTIMKCNKINDYKFYDHEIYKMKNYSR